MRGLCIWDFPKIRLPYFGVLMIRILLLRVLYQGPLFSETPPHAIKRKTSVPDGRERQDHKRTKNDALIVKKYAPSAYSSPKSELSSILGFAAVVPRCSGQVCRLGQVAMVWATFWFWWAGCPNLRISIGK